MFYLLVNRIVLIQIGGIGGTCVQTAVLQVSHGISMENTYTYVLFHLIAIIEIATREKNVLTTIFKLMVLKCGIFNLDSS